MTSCLCVVNSEQWGPMTFCANSDDRVKKISEHVRSKTNIPVQDQVLMLGSNTLQPQRKLSSYGIDKEQIIYLTLKVVKTSDEELPLTLVESSHEGQRYLLHVRRSNSVAQVKEMIKICTAIPPKKQIVMCNGKKLEDGKTMADYNIKRGNFLFLAPYCIGGGGVTTFGERTLVPYWPWDILPISMGIYTEKVEFESDMEEDFS